MSACDLCGRDLTEGSDRLQLHVGQLVNREFEKRKVTSALKNIRPVEVQICRRHRMDLIKQRIMPMIIGFVLLFFPVQFFVGLAGQVIPIDLTTQIILSFVLDAVLVYFLSRLIAYDALVAYQLNARSRKDGVEYIPQRKYRMMMRSMGR